MKQALLCVTMVTIWTISAWADCPDKMFICPTGEQFKIGTCFNKSHFQCETCKSIKKEVRKKCPKPFPKCDAECMTAWFARGDGCSFDLKEVADLIKTNSVKWPKVTTAVFRASCNIHDLCYGVPGRSKDACDEEFVRNMQTTCTFPGVGTVFKGLLRKVAPAPLLSSCSEVAVGGGAIVAQFGEPAYEKGQNWAAGYQQTPAVDDAEVMIGCSDLRSDQHRRLSIELPSNASIVVDLCSNASTGYRWGENAVIQNLDVVNQASHEFIAPRSTRPGAAGHQRWTLKGLRPGTSRVRFEYVRPWESAAPEWTVELVVEVPGPAPQTEWVHIPDRAQYGGADWKNEIDRAINISLEEAKRIASGDSRISYFFYVTGGMNLGSKGAFRPGDAVFFAGEPWYGSAPGRADAYEKVGREPPPRRIAGSPEVDWLERESHPAVPQGLKVSCTTGSDNLGSSLTCPVIRWNGYTYWAYSHIDNRLGMTVVAYDATGSEVRRWSRNGARYIWNIGLDASAGTATLWGQANRTIVIPLDEISVPAGLVPPDEPTRPLPAPHPDPHVTTLGDRDNGSTVNLEVGEVLAVVLRSNPTTGHRWALSEISEPAVLEKTETDYRPDPVPEGLVGSGGREVWRFRALGCGTARLRLEYRQSWMKDVEAERTFSASVLVERPD